MPPRRRIPRTRTAPPRPPSPAPAGKTPSAPPSAPPSKGLYGSSTEVSQGRTAAAELVGTYLLVLVGTSVATTSVLDSGSYSAGFVGLSFGLALTALVAGLGHISGCHVNPAVTLGLAATGLFPWKHVPAYVAAQFAGAILAALTVWGAYGDAARDKASLGATLPADGVGALRAILVEVVITFLLVFVVCAVATDDRVPDAIAPVAVGFALAAAVYVGVPVTGGAVNPARAFGPELLSLNFTLVAVYLLAPVAGGVLGALFYDKVLRKAEAPS